MKKYPQNSNSHMRVCADACFFALYVGHLFFSKEKEHQPFNWIDQQVGGAEIRQISQATLSSTDLANVSDLWEDAVGGVENQLVLFDECMIRSKCKNKF